MELIVDWEGSGCIQDGVATLACIPIVFQNLVNALVVLAGIVAVFLIIYSGYKFVTSEGDPEKVSGARKTLLYAIGGFVFIVLAYVFLNIIAQTTGVERIAPGN